MGRIDAAEQPKAAAIIVHGPCEHYDRHYCVVERLPEAGYGVVCFAHRGHERSMDKRLRYDNCTQIASDTDPLVEETRSQFPDLPLFAIGHSMVAFGAASYDAARPGKMASYILSGALTRDRTGLASSIIAQGTDRETRIPNELGDGVGPVPTQHTWPTPPWRGSSLRCRRTARRPCKTTHAVACASCETSD